MISVITLLPNFVDPVFSFRWKVPVRFEIIYVLDEFEILFGALFDRYVHEQLATKHHCRGICTYRRALTRFLVNKFNYLVIDMRHTIPKRRQGDGLLMSFKICRPITIRADRDFVH